MIRITSLSRQERTMRLENRQAKVYRSDQVASSTNFETTVGGTP
jgi:hypothetical protein